MDILAPEEALVERHKAGDPAAFTELFAQFKDGVYAYLCRCRIPNGSRDDLAQEIFLRIHGALARFVPDKPLKAWVYTIVANSVRSYYRQNRPERAPLELTESDASDSAPRSDETLVGRETAEWLEDMVAHLPLDERQVVLLCCVEQLDQDAVAGIVGMPVNTVKTHLRRARLKLAQALHRRQMVAARESGS